MDITQYSSKLLQEAIEEFAQLPGIGRKTALRLVLHLLKLPSSKVEHFGNTLIKLRNEVRYCSVCNNISESETCSICSNPNRDHSLICVVENLKDVISIESTHQYNGTYHVLGGIISPMDGIGPNDLNIANLEEKIKKGHVKEIVLALSTTMEGDTTNFYIYKKFNSFPIKITTIARGISFGDELEYADEVTLGKSIRNRVVFENTLTSK